jgi:hypothetical protein
MKAALTSSHSKLKIMPLVQLHNADFLNLPLCANTEEIDDEEASCQNVAEQACSSCKLVQVCCSEIHTANFQLLDFVFVPLAN